jgi:4-hydroxybutyrate dehydrogenase
MALITYLTKIQFDFGALSLLSQELAQLGMRRPLVVTDKGCIAAGLLDRVRGVLPNDLDVSIFDGTPPNPTEAASLEALALYRERECDGIVALGGGSPMDLAKAVRLLATHEGPLAQYALVEGGVPRIRRDVARMVAIPTTAGTGSEVGRGAVINLNDGRKLGVISPYLIPDVAICDPELTMDLPPSLTAGTGMDAIAHCIETYIAPAVNPPAEAIALDGLARGWKHLERAFRDGGDREARWNMMMASMEGAMAFQKGLGAVHAMSHPMGALHDLKLHHGTLNAVVMPAVLRFNQSHTADKYARLAEVMGLPAGADLSQAIARLTQRLGLPRSLREMGLTEAHIPPLAEAAVKDHTNGTNPRPAGIEDYRRLFEEALG